MMLIKEINAHTPLIKLKLKSSSRTSIENILVFFFFQLGEFTYVSEVCLLNFCWFFFFIFFGNFYVFCFYVFLTLREREREGGEGWRTERGRDN